MLSLNRFVYHPSGTLGVIDISLEGVEERFWTIERPWRDNERNVSCIPEGEYPLEWRESPRFGMSWHVDDVPSRSHILLHVANYPTDVQGCIGLGTDLLGNGIAVAKSRAAMERFEAITRGYHWSLRVKFVSDVALRKV